MLGIKHRHILDFTVPTKLQGGLHNPNPLPGRSHLSLSSGHETGRWGLCRRGTEQGLQWDRAVVIICARASFPAETRLSWTASLVTHCSLWPEQKRQLKARRKNRRTGKSSDSPGDRQEGGEGLCGAQQGDSATRGEQRRVPCTGAVPPGTGSRQRALPKGHSHRHTGR